MNFHRLLLPPFWLSCFIAGTRLLYMVAGPGSCGGGKLSFVEPGLPVSEWHHLLLCVSWTRIGFPRSRLWDGGLGTEIWVLFFFFFFFWRREYPWDQFLWDRRGSRTGAREKLGWHVVTPGPQPIPQGPLEQQCPFRVALSWGKRGWVSECPFPASPWDQAAPEKGGWLWVRRPRAVTREGAAASPQPVAFPEVGGRRT